MAMSSHGDSVTAGSGSVGSGVAEFEQLSSKLFEKTKEYLQSELSSTVDSYSTLQTMNDLTTKVRSEWIMDPFIGLFGCIEYLFAKVDLNLLLSLVFNFITEICQFSRENWMYSEVPGSG